jgi:hypothetical protein
METKTKFEELLKDLSAISHLHEKEILHMQVQTAAMMYRFLTKDLEALDIVIHKDGEIKIYKEDCLVKISNKVRRLIIWAVFRSMESKIFLDYKIN